MRLLLNSSVSAFILLTSAASSTWADGLICRLPEDGTWARYDTRILIRNTNDKEVTGSLTIRSVGRKTVNEQECRWVEVHWQRGTINNLWKFLIPERYITLGQKPFEHRVQAWRGGLGNVRELKEMPRSTVVHNFLLGPVEDVKQLSQTESVEWQRGKFERCKLLTGDTYGHALLLLCNK